MDTREYYELFRYLMEQCCLPPEDLLYVENIAMWCEERGISEPDKERPLKLVAEEGTGFKILVRENIAQRVVDDRINAMRIRGQLKSLAVDRADLLDSDRKKLAFLFLSEYATSLPDLEDELLADDWVLGEMERLGFFKE